MGRAGEIRRQLIRGEYETSDDPRVVLTTVLGSCIATCLYDPVRSVGGMNHFNLPSEPGADGYDSAKRYGVGLMELLINGLLKGGAERDRLEAKVFGGATMARGLPEIGSANARFARQFLTTEGIRIVSFDVGGDRARRVEFRPAIGHARRIVVEQTGELLRTSVGPADMRNAGDVELF